MKMRIVFFVMFCITVLFANAQNTGDTLLVKIETTDGNEFIGQVISDDSTKTVLKTEKLGEITILKADIKNTESVQVQQIKDGKLWFENPQSTRYFWSPNGYGLKRGEGYYQNIWVLWNQFSYGVTDYFSIGAGIVPAFLFGGAPTPIFITPKFSIPVKKDQFNIGVGAIVGTVLGEEGTGFGILYSNATFGSRDANVSIGGGAMFAGGEWAPSPLINFSGMFRITNRGYFITENYLISADGTTVVMFSAGGRWIIKKAAIDYGLFLPISSDIDTFIALPWLGFTIPFGKTN
jgi:hypothetical protein